MANKPEAAAEETGVLEPRRNGVGLPQEGVPRGRNSKCQGPEAGTRLVHARNGEELEQS